MKLNVEITLDGSDYCALIGSDVMEGVSGFGKTPALALHDLANEIESEGYTIMELLSVTTGE